MGVVLRLGQINATNSTSGFLVKNNFLTGGTSHGIRFDGGGDLNGITVEQNMIYATSNGVEVLTYTPPGTNGITIRENIITGNGTGVLLSGDYTTVVTNRIFVNNNNLADNYRGVYVDGITNNNTVNTNMFDLRFNYWGSELGPVRGNGIANAPVFAKSDSVRIIGYVPFNHSNGSLIEDNNGTSHGRWVIYPVAVTATDASAACGWTASTMMGPVLRVNGAGDQILGMYNTITNARDNASPLSYPATTGPRNTSDQIVLVAGTGVTPYGTFGYAAASSVEPSYPVVFDQAPQPSVIRGLNRPRITMGVGGTGNIRVASTYPTGFTIKDFIEHIATSGANVTMIEFLNPYSNVADYNFMTSSFNHTSFTGIRFDNSTATDANNTQTFTNNRITLGRNPAWPGMSGILSAPISFIGIEIANRGTGGNNSVNVSNNEISTNVASGTKSTGISINATNNNSASSVNSNIIRHMAAANADVSDRSSKWGTAIYITQGNSFSVNFNSIEGGNFGGSKGHDGITLDRPTNFTLYGNLIGRSYASLKEEGSYTGSPKRGYAIKLFSSDVAGSGSVNGVNIDNCTIGNFNMGCASGGVYAGGVNGALTFSLTNSYIYGSNNPNTGSTSGGAAIQIATSLYGDAASSGTINIWNNFLGESADAFHNTLDLAIGTTPDGSFRNSLANNLQVSVMSNNFLDYWQRPYLNRAVIADGRPSAGSNIRNIFGRGTGTSIFGNSVPGEGQSGNNRFGHAAILTSEPNLANYSVAMSRTARAQQLNPSSSTEPVKIWRFIQDPLSNAKSIDSINTVEVRENKNYSGPLMSIAGYSYN